MKVDVDNHSQHQKLGQMACGSNLRLIIDNSLQVHIFQACMYCPLKFEVLPLLTSSVLLLC